MFEKHDVCLGAKTEVQKIFRKGKVVRVEELQEDGVTYKNKTHKRDVTDEVKFVAIQEHLRDLKPLSALVKMDIEGSEWEVLNNMTDEDFDKILILDAEFHYCRPREVRALEIATALKKLKERFYITSRMKGDRDEVNGWQLGCCGKCAGRKNHYDMFSISYVNKKLFNFGSK